MRFRRGKVAFCLLLWVQFDTGLAQEAEPFRIRNLNPLTSIFGLPTWETASPGTHFGLTTALANHYRLSQRPPDTLVLDGETLRTSLFLTHELRDRWSFGLEIPYYQQSGGMLDDLVDIWHSAFGLPDGGRNNRGEDELLFVLGDDGGPFFRLDERQRGLGDTQLSVARRIGVDGRFVLQGTVKLPTGDEGMLAGSGSTDWSLTLLRSRSLAVRNRPAGLYWGLGALRLGEPERVAFDSETLGYVAVLGASWQPWDRVGLKAQLDLHSALYNTPLEEIGEKAIQATLGGWVRVTQRAALEFAVVEDLAVSTAPDVVLHATLRWSW
jgi:hypothetical protein